MTDPIHFAARITTDATGTTFIALCGYAGFNSLMFSNEKGIVKKSLGGCVTCPRCIEMIGVKPT